MEIDDILNFPYDPWLLLGVPGITDDKSVISAWKKSGAPRNGPLAEAYDMLKDEASRALTGLLLPRPYMKASDAASAMRKQPVFLGPGVWYDEIMRRRNS